MESTVKNGDFKTSISIKEYGSNLEENNLINSSSCIIISQIYQIF